LVSLAAANPNALVPAAKSASPFLDTSAMMPRPQTPNGYGLRQLKAMTIDKLFFFSALIGTVLFLVQLVLGLIGWGGDTSDIDFGDPGGADGNVGHHSADTSFKVLSLQGLSAFIMMFGLVGLAMRNDNGLGPVPSVVGAAGAGTLATWVISRIFRLFNGLQSKGNLDMQKAVGAEGTVYLTIKKDKPGKVQLIVSGRMLTLDAMTEDDKTLKTGTTVTVIRVTTEQHLIVSGNNYEELLR
jgi:membrane protein implicated in regulation of membrane protease activity